MNSLIGILIAALIMGYFYTREDKSGVSNLETQLSTKESLQQNIKEAKEVSDLNNNSVQDRIDAEFGR